MTAEADAGLDPGLDVHDSRVAMGAEGLLRDFNRAGVLTAADVHVARRLARLGSEIDERVLLAAALAVRAVRQGAVCVVLADASSTVVADDALRLDDAPPAWPDPADWLAACEAICGRPWSSSAWRARV